jgi:hypothetical protein
MKRIRLGLVLLVAGFVLLITAYSLLMASYVRMPGKLEGADFLAYYSVGRVARADGLSRVYDLDLEAAAQAETAGVPLGTLQVLPPNHPPFLYPFLTLLAELDYRRAYFGYALLLIFLVVAGLPSLYRALRENGWPRASIWIALAGVLLFEPFFFSVLKGQDSAVLLLGGLLWFSGLARNDDRLAGLGLSLMLIRPQIALLLAVPFLFRRRKVWWWFCAGVLALGLYSFIQVGWTGVKDYLYILTISSGGTGYGLAEAAMFNFTGLVMRLAPGLEIGLVHALGWGLFATALVGLCALWGFSKTIGYRHIVLAVTLSLFAAPHLHYHDLALLVVPLLGLGMAGVAAGRWTVRQAATLPILASVILLFSEFWNLAHFIIPYLLMTALIVFSWIVEKNGIFVFSAWQHRKG